MMGLVVLETHHRRLLRPRIIKVLMVMVVGRLLASQVHVVYNTFLMLWTPARLLHSSTHVTSRVHILLPAPSYYAAQCNCAGLPYRYST
jgi:hypothetical protein